MEISSVLSGVVQVGGYPGMAWWRPTETKKGRVGHGFRKLLQWGGVARGQWAMARQEGREGALGLRAGRVTQPVGGQGHGPWVRRLAGPPLKHGRPNATAAHPAGLS